MCCPYTPGCRVIFWRCVLPTKSQTLEENRLSVPLKPSVTTASQGWGFIRPPCSRKEHDWLETVQAKQLLWVHKWSGPVRSPCLMLVLPDLWPSQSSCSLLWWLLSPGVCVFHLWLNSLLALILCALTSCEFLRELLSTLYRNLSDEDCGGLNKNGPTGLYICMLSLQRVALFEN